MPRLLLVRMALCGFASVAPVRLDAQTTESAGIPGPALALSEGEVVARALRTSPEVATASGGVRTSGAAMRSAAGAYLPSLELVSSVNRSNSTSIGSTASQGWVGSYGAGVVASLEVFTGGRRGAERARARAGQDAADATLIERRFAVMLEARRGFYGVLRGEDLVRAADARMAEATRGLGYAEARHRAGTATRSDVLRARLELTLARQQRLAASDTLLTAEYALGRTVGVQGAVRARRPAALETRTLTLGDSAIVELAAGDAPVVLASRARASAGEAGVRAARSQYVPGIRLTAGYNWVNETLVTPAGAPRPGWALQLGTVFPLFDGFRREEAVVFASAEAEAARVTAADTERLARAEAARLVGALHYAEQSVDLANEAVTTAREDLRVQSQRYRNGLSTYLDVLLSQTALVAADLGLVEARFSYQVARAALEALLGRPL